MGSFKKKEPEQLLPEPPKENPMEKMDPTVRPEGVSMVQLLMKEPCAMPPFEKMEESLVELYPTCEAVYSLNSGKLILADTVRNREVEGLDRYIRYIVNARFVNISGTNDHIVDTLGLSLLFAEDLQYHFHDMDPNWVVGHAYSMASYILANDRPIKDGDTIDGVTDGHFDQGIQWKCHFEGAMLKPERAVLDVYMDEYAAGNRQGK